VQLDLLAQPPLEPHAVAEADNQHPQHQLGVGCPLKSGPP
jgi:hypothetical protein